MTLRVAAVCTPLMVTATDPADGTTRVVLTPVLTITFSKPVQVRNASAVALRSATGLVSCNLTFNAQSGSISFAPVGPLAQGSRYFWSIGSSAFVDQASNLQAVDTQSLAALQLHAFYTRDLNLPFVLTAHPLANAVLAPTSQLRVSLSFQKM